MTNTGCNECAFSKTSIYEFPCKDCFYTGGTNNFETPKGHSRCKKCGVIIPEGRHICLTCEGQNEMQTFIPKPEKRPPIPPVNPPKAEAVNHPAHYQGKHECIDEMISLFGVDVVKGFCMCNVYKYRFRAARKNGAEDIAKADWYMDKLMELEGSNK